MMCVMKNNNPLYEYAANSATTTINHYMLYVINMAIETDYEHIHHDHHHQCLS